MDAAAGGEEAAIAGITRDASSLLDAIVLNLWVLFSKWDLDFLGRGWKPLCGKGFFDQV